MSTKNLKNDFESIVNTFFDKALENRTLLKARNWYRIHRSKVLASALAVIALSVIVLKATGRELADAAQEETTTVEEVTVQEETPVVETDPYRSEAEAVAKVLYGTARGNTETDQRAVVWCIINRCESQLYPNTIEGVCSQNQQWMGYSNSNPIIKSLYDIATEELTTWHEGGYRMIAPDFLFMSWSANEIVLRTQFEENAATRYWRAK